LSVKFLLATRISGGKGRSSTEQTTIINLKIHESGQKENKQSTRRKFKTFRISFLLFLRSPNQPSSDY